MDVIDNQGRVVGRIVKAGITQVSQGRKTRRVECVAQLLLPGCQADSRRFPDIWEARAWIAQEACAHPLTPSPREGELASSLREGMTGHAVGGAVRVAPSARDVLPCGGAAAELRGRHE